MGGVLCREIRVMLEEGEGREDQPKPWTTAREPRPTVHQLESSTEMSCMEAYQLTDALEDYR